jgi:tetratricopeptide (TPR) repeat protein
LGPWQAPPAEFAKRNLGLAYFNVGREKRSGAYFERSYELLSSLPSDQRDDAVSAAQAFMLLGTGQARKAVRLFQRATELEPGRAEYWLDLGTAESASGDLSAAITSLRRGIQSDRYDYRPYKALADMYEQLGDPAAAKKAWTEFLRLVPQSILMRVASGQ